MKLSENTHRDLKRYADACKKEMREVEVEISRLQEKREAIRRTFEYATGLLEQGAEKPKGAAHKQLDVGFSEPGKVDARQMSFRDIIRAILKAESRPLRPAQVSAIFKKAKIEYNAKTDLTTRIGNELYRMNKNGELVKTGHRYSLPNE